MLYQAAVGLGRDRDIPLPSRDWDKSSCPRPAIRPNLSLAPSSPHTTELSQPGPGSVAGALSITLGLSLQRGKAGNAQFTVQL